jgi:predicted NodU family carbamoyl transferase/ferredoxin
LLEQTPQTRAFPSAPLTDGFGTRLQPSEILAGLSVQGLPGARLMLHDQGVTVQYAGEAQQSAEAPQSGKGQQSGEVQESEVVARASTWLRSLLSPLVACRFEKLSQAPAEPLFVDERTHVPSLVALAEVFDPQTGFANAIEDILQRLPLQQLPRTARKRSLPTPTRPGLAAMLQVLKATLDAALTAHDVDPAHLNLAVIEEGKDGPQLLGALTDEGLGLLVWERAGGPHGVRPAVLLAASLEPAALKWLAVAMDESQALDTTKQVLLDGLVWGVGRRPTIATTRPQPPQAFLPIVVDSDRCSSCGLCAQMCPTNYLDNSGHPATPDTDVCIRCYDCVEACPEDALRPGQGPDAATLSATLHHRPGWLSRLRGAAGPAFPAPFPPSYLLPKVQSPQKPTWVLGLAVTTMQEHAAVLLKDGQVVGAIEEERIVRRRHHGWKSPGRAGVTLGVDATLALEEAFCRRSIRALLEQAGITLDDVDLLAFNGIPARYRRTFSLVDPGRPVRTLAAGRLVFVPHHLCHAASSFRVSGAKSAWIFSVDGRGDRETAALFRAEDDKIERIFELLSLNDRSIGGTYETATRILGFGSHGQGSTMALASFGRPTYATDAFLSVRALDDVSIHESGPEIAYGALRRGYDDPLTDEHRNFAASIQHALETSVQALVRLGGVPVNADALCLAGGVTLNCAMNGALKRTFQPQQVFAQPAANDAGTALGAALEASVHAQSGDPPWTMQHANLGPQFSDDEILPVLRRSGLRYRRVANIAAETAQRVANGEVLCWFQGRMEFGPRALGARSIVADPRNPTTKARVNLIKDRQDWRPFAPSILAGHEGEWLEDAFDSRFMLFALQVHAHKQAVVPAIVHVDGTTRPQVVHAEHQPLYHEMITHFHHLTGVPLVVNTSFNRRGEPIVCTPKDALESFLGLGADAMAIGNFMVEQVGPEPAPRPELPNDKQLLQFPGGRRLALRLTTACDCEADFCTIQDLRGMPDRSFDDALLAMAEGREAGCDELVFLRGEVAKRADLPDLVARARKMGYRFVQVQTSGRPLADTQKRELLLRAGVDCFEIQLVAPDEALHDELLRTPGAFRETVAAIQAIARSGRQLLVTVPVLRRTQKSLGRSAVLLQRLGVKRIQFNFPRPVEMPEQVLTNPLPQLAQASRYVRMASQMAVKLGLTVSTEGIPLCHLDEPFRDVPDASESWNRHRVDDLHLLHESLTTVRAQARPEPPPCRACALRANCPKTWALYQELFGTGEFIPFPV